MRAVARVRPGGAITAGTSIPALQAGALSGWEQQDYFPFAQSRLDEESSCPDCVLQSRNAPILVPRPCWNSSTCVRTAAMKSCPDGADLLLRGRVLAGLSRQCL